MKNKRHIQIISDDSGWLTLVVFNAKYAHEYDNTDQLVDDILAIMDNNDPSAWEGNQWDDENVGQWDNTCIVFAGTANQIINEILAKNDEDCGLDILNLKKSLA